MSMNLSITVIASGSFGDRFTVMITNLHTRAGRKYNGLSRDYYYYLSELLRILN